jgi:menaquinone-dependent protoporphyrinogen IX oxidase
MTERKSVTCPESGHLEEVELDRTPLGLVVVGCSRFGGGIECARECAHRLDKRALAQCETRERVLIVVNKLGDDAARIASQLSEDLVGDDLVVEIAEAGRGAPPPADYDAVVIGAQVNHGQLSRELLDYVREYHDELDAMPAFFYSVGAYDVLRRDVYTRKMSHRTAWSPADSTSFADAGETRRGDVREFARTIADAVPPALVVPTML